MGRLEKDMWGSWLSFISLILLMGCASPQKAIYLAPSFDQLHVDTITLLPIFDARTQRKFEIDEFQLQQIVNPVVETGLNEKGYTMALSNEMGRVQCLKFGHSTNLEPDCLHKVGPPNSRWILVIFLQDFQMRSPYGGTASAKMSGVLFDKSEGVMLWRDLEYAGLSQRELVGENMKTLIVNDVIQLCTGKLIDSLPRKISNSKG